MFYKKHIAPVLAVLFFLISKDNFSQSILDYRELANSNIRTFREKGIQSLTLLKANCPIKTVKYNPSKNALIILNREQDTLYTMYYNSCDSLYKISEGNRFFYIKYLSLTDSIPFKEIKFTGDITDTLKRISFPYPERPGIKQKEYYIFSKTSKDTLDQLLTTTVLNKKDTQWSYQFTKRQGYTDKKYFNGITVSQRMNSNTTLYDSIVPISRTGRIQYQYRFVSDSVFTSIIKDTTYESLTVSGKKIYEKTLTGNRILDEVYFLNNTDILKKVSNIYYPTSEGKPVLWQKIETDIVANRTKKTYPNRKDYKLAKGILKRKKNRPMNLLYCGGAQIIATYTHENFWLSSSSILFPDNTRFFDEVKMIILSDYYKQLPQDEIDIQNWNFVYSRDSTSTYNQGIDVPGKRLSFSPLTYSKSLRSGNLSVEIETSKGIFYQPLNYSDIEYEPIPFSLIYFTINSTKR
ncbi:hypothetical protein [Niabella aquatica]